MKTIKTVDISSIGIRLAAEEAGIAEVEILADNGKTGDERITIYEVGPVMVADTNGDPVWREQDEAAWQELMESEGIEL